MKNLIFLVTMIVFQTVQAEEICIDENKYDSFVESIKMVLKPTYEFEAHLSYIEGYMVAREFIDRTKNAGYLEAMDELINLKFSLLNTSLSILKIEKIEFDSKYKNRIINLSVGIKKSLGEFRTSQGIDNMEILLSSLGYDEY